MKGKITTGTNDRPKDETMAGTGEGLPDDNGSVIEVGSDGTAEVRGESDNVNRIPGSAVDAENQDQSEADHSPARQKDQARDEPKSAGSGDAAPDEDTYD